MLSRNHKTFCKMKEKMKKHNLKYILLWVLASITVFLIFGIPTALIKTPYFKRMIEATALDYFFLVAISILIGAYIGLYAYNKNKKGNICAYTGAFACLFAVICPICNALLVALFGASGLMLYFEPLRPILGWMAVILLSLGIYLQAKIERKPIAYHSLVHKIRKGEKHV